MAKHKKKNTGGPYLAAAVFCDSILEDKSGKMSALGIADSCQLFIAKDAPQNIPSKELQLPMIQNALLMFKSGYSPGNHQLRLVVEQPDGQRNEVLKKTLDFTPLPHGGFNVKTQINFNIAANGIYWLDVILDNKRLTRMPLKISVQRLPDQDDESDKASLKKSGRGNN